MAEYLISTDQSLLDFEFIVRSLQSTYWAGTRSRELIIASISASLCFGAYDSASREQVGFARVVTDRLTFSWLADVFVAPSHRGRGVGKQLVTAVVAHPDVAPTKVHLHTKDAHGLYAQFGFRPWDGMRRLPDSDVDWRR